MKIKCPSCGNEVILTRLCHDESSMDNFYERCPNCSVYFEFDGLEIAAKSFVTDVAKMADFKVLTEKEFLASYDYITEEEYDATVLYMNWLNQDDSEP